MLNERGPGGPGGSVAKVSSQCSWHLSLKWPSALQHSMAWKRRIQGISKSLEYKLCTFKREATTTWTSIKPKDHQTSRSDAMRSSLRDSAIINVPLSTRRRWQRCVGVARISPLSRTSSEVLTLDTRQIERQRDRRDRQASVQVSRESSPFVSSLAFVTQLTWTAQGDSKPHSQCRHGIVSRAKGNGQTHLLLSLPSHLQKAEAKPQGLTKTWYTAWIWRV